MSEKKQDIFKKALKVAFKWLEPGVYGEVVDPFLYEEALQNEKYSREYQKDLQLLKKAYLELEKEV